MYKIILTAVIMVLSGCAAENTRPFIVAHRGASHDAPENTIPAFLLAWEQGADAIEGDFFLTKDGEIVCFHDANTRRLSGKDMLVSNATLEELRLLDVGTWKGQQWEGTGMPTLAEVFQLVPDDKKIFVEIKSGTEIMTKLYDEIDNSGLRTDQIVIISFNSEVIREIKLNRPEHKAYWLSGLTRDDNGQISPGIETIIETLDATLADGFSSHYLHVSDEYIARIKAEGYEYHVWTVNDPEIAADLWQRGILSVTTDLPGLTREYFEDLKGN
ncbi:MAG: glycerophosphodiester phosphodiesterase [Bacteroidales bacterium]